MYKHIANLIFKILMVSRYCIKHIVIKENLDSIIRQNRKFEVSVVSIHIVSFLASPSFLFYPHCSVVFVVKTPGSRMA